MIKQDVKKLLAEGYVVMAEHDKKIAKEWEATEQDWEYTFVLFEAVQK